MPRSLARAFEQEAEQQQQQQGSKQGSGGAGRPRPDQESLRGRVQFEACNLRAALDLEGSVGARLGGPAGGGEIGGHGWCMCSDLGAIRVWRNGILELLELVDGIWGLRPRVNLAAR